MKVKCLIQNKIMFGFNPSEKQTEEDDVWASPIFRFQLPVTCGHLKGTLNKDRMSKGWTDSDWKWKPWMWGVSQQSWDEHWFSFRGEMHFVPAPVVHSWWIWKVCRDGELPELEVNRSMSRYLTGKTDPGLFLKVILLSVHNTCSSWSFRKHMFNAV